MNKKTMLILGAVVAFLMYQKAASAATALSDAAGARSGRIF